MGENEPAKRERLARLERELADLKAALPEHCHGADGYIGVHAASPDLLDKIESTEEAIAKLKAELGR